MPFQIIHNKLLEEIGLPTWGSYLIFAVATIILGAVLGLVSNIFFCTKYIRKYTYKQQMEHYLYLHTAHCVFD